MGTKWCHPTSGPEALSQRRTALCHGLAVVLCLIPALLAHAQEPLAQPPAQEPLAQQPAQEPPAGANHRLIVMGLAKEAETLREGLALYGYRIPSAALAEFDDALRAARKLPKKFTAAEVDRTFERLDAALNAVMRHPETIELAYTGGHGLRTSRKPRLLPVTDGVPRAIPFILRNQSLKKVDFEEGAEGAQKVVLRSHRTLRRLWEVAPASAEERLRLEFRFDGRPRKVEVPIQRSPSQRVHVRVLDEAGQPTPTRIHVRGPRAMPYAAEGAAQRLTSSYDVYQYVPGRFSISLPPGRTWIEFVKGHEYEVERVAIEVVAGAHAADDPLEVRLSRWSDLSKQGWYTGEGHIHMTYGGSLEMSPEEVLLQVQAEDLNAANLLVVGAADRVFDQAYFEARVSQLSTPRYQLRWNQEYRNRLYGHMIFYDLQALTVPIFSGYPKSPLPRVFPLNADVADQVLGQGGWVTGAHTTGGRDEHVIDIALAKMGGLEVVGYGVHHGFALPVLRALWNAGFRTVPTAGTDAFLDVQRGDPLGGGRCYAKVDGEFSMASWVEAMKAGRVFVSNAPTLMLDVAGRGPGDAIELGAEPKRLDVRVEARSQWPLNRVELYLDGALVGQSDAPAEGARELIHEMQIEVSRSGWIAAKVVGRANRYVFGGKVYPNPEQFAHTAPVWIEVTEEEGAPNSRSGDAERLRKWSQEFAAQIEANSATFTEAQRSHMRDVYRRGCQVYADLAGAPGCSIGASEPASP